MTDFLIDSARPQDAAAISDLLQRSYSVLLAPDYPDEILAAALPRIAWARPQLLNCGTYFVARDGAALVGAGGWTSSTPFGRAGVPGVGHIRHVVSDPDRVRQGIASAVFETVFETARASGIRSLNCLSTRTAAPFYAAKGFQGLGNVELRLAPELLFPAVQMQWVET